jgi:hypothetical protein
MRGPGVIPVIQIPPALPEVFVSRSAVDEFTNADVIAVFSFHSAIFKVNVGPSFDGINYHASPSVDIGTCSRAEIAETAVAGVGGTAIHMMRGNPRKGRTV